MHFGLVNISGQYLYSTEQTYLVNLIILLASRGGTPPMHSSCKASEIELMCRHKRRHCSRFSLTFAAISYRFLTAPISADTTESGSMPV